MSITRLPDELLEEELDDEELEIQAEFPEHMFVFVGQHPFTQQLVPQTLKLHPPPPPPPPPVVEVEEVVELPDEDELLELDEVQQILFMQIRPLVH